MADGAKVAQDDGLGQHKRAAGVELHRSSSQVSDFDGYAALLDGSTHVATSGVKKQRLEPQSPSMLLMQPLSPPTPDSLAAPQAHNKIFNSPSYQQDVGGAHHAHTQDGQQQLQVAQVSNTAAQATITVLRNTVNKVSPFHNTNCVTEALKQQQQPASMPAAAPPQREQRQQQLLQAGTHIMQQQYSTTSSCVAALLPPGSPAARGAFGAAAAAATAATAAAAANGSPSPVPWLSSPSPRPPTAAGRLHLNSLLLVASRLTAGNAGGTDTVATPGSTAVAAGACAGGARGSSPLLPSTQATLEATTAKVVAAEVLAAALAGSKTDEYQRAWVGLGSNSLPTAAVPSEAAAAAAAAHASAQQAVAAEACSVPANGTQPADAQQQQQRDGQQAARARDEPGSSAVPQSPQLPSWLCSSSAGLAATGAICRASLLSTTAALARLNQPLPQPPHSPVLPGCSLAAAAAVPDAAAASAAALQAGSGVVLGIPVPGGVVVGRPVQPQPLATAVHGAMLAGRACRNGVGQLTIGTGAVGTGTGATGLLMPALQLQLPYVHKQQGPEEVEEQLECHDAASCSSTPRHAAAAGGAEGAAASAAARLLQRTHSFCCWDSDQQQMDACEAAAVAEEKTAAAAGEVKAANQQQNGSLRDVAVAGEGEDAAAVVVVVDLAPKCSAAADKACNVPSQLPVL